MVQGTNNRIFVMGCSRGGTTVVQRRLSEGLNLYTLPETRFFSNLLGNAEERLFPQTARPRGPVRKLTSGLREKLGRSTGREHVDLEGITLPRARKWARVQGRTAQFVAQLDRAAQAGGHIGWLEKSPTHTHYAHDIHRLVPDAWMIHVIRDPRDTVASIWDAAQRYGDPWGVIYDRIERAVDKWNAATRASAAMMGRPRQVFMSYQQFTENPRAALDHIGQVIGLPDGPASTTQTQIATPSEPWKANALAAPIHPARSKWRRALNEAERAAVEAHLCPQAMAFLDSLTRRSRGEEQRHVA